MGWVVTIVHLQLLLLCQLIQHGVQKNLIKGRTVCIRLLCLPGILAAFFFCVESVKYKTRNGKCVEIL